MDTERTFSFSTSNRLMLTNLAFSISRAWGYTTVLRLHHRQTWRHGTEGWRHASEGSKWMILQCATFSKIWTLEISRKPFQISTSVSGSHLKAVFGYPYPIVNSLSCRISTDKPDNDHLWCLYVLACEAH